MIGMNFLGEKNKKKDYLLEMIENCLKISNFNFKYFFPESEYLLGFR